MPTNYGQWAAGLEGLGGMASGIGSAYDRAFSQKKAEQAAAQKYADALAQQETENKFKQDEFTYRKEHDKAAADLALQLAGMKGNKINKPGGGLSPNNILTITEGASIPKMLGDVAGTIAQNKDIFGPVGGTIGMLNPWNEKTKTAESQLRTAAQMVGKYMEGGVLRKEDEEKYRRMLPQLSDTPDIAENKLQTVQRMLVNKYNNDVDTLTRAGYGTDMFPKFEPADIPSIIRGGVGGASTENKSDYEAAIDVLGNPSAYDPEIVAEARTIAQRGR